MTSPETPDAQEGRRFRLVALLVVGVVAVAGVVGLLLLHLLRPDASATFIQQITLLASGIATAGGIVWGLGRIARNQAVIREQVQNSHATPLRDDLDGKHDRLIAGQQLIANALGEIRKDIGGIRQDVRDERAERRHLAERFDDHLKEHS